MAEPTQEQKPTFPETLYVRQEAEKGEDAIFLAGTSLRESMETVRLGEPTWVAIYRLEEASVAQADAEFTWP